MQTGILKWKASDPVTGSTATFSYNTSGSGRNVKEYEPLGQEVSIEDPAELPDPPPNESVSHWIDMEWQCMIPREYFNSFGSLPFHCQMQDLMSLDHGLSDIYGWYRKMPGEKQHKKRAHVIIHHRPSASDKILDKGLRISAKPVKEDGGQEGSGEPCTIVDKEGTEHSGTRGPNGECVLEGNQTYTVTVRNDDNYKVVWNQVSANPIYPGSPKYPTWEPTLIPIPKHPFERDDNKAGRKAFIEDCLEKAVKDRIDKLNSNRERSLNSSFRTSMMLGVDTVPNLLPVPLGSATGGTDPFKGSNPSDNEVAASSVANILINPLGTATGVLWTGAREGTYGSWKHRSARNNAGQITASDKIDCEVQASKAGFQE